MTVLRPHVLLATADGVAFCELAQALEGNGYPFSAVRNGDDALERLLSEGGPKVAVLDRRLRGATGDEVVRRVREHFVRSADYVYCVLLDREGDGAPDVAADSALPAPFDPFRLMVALQSILRINTRVQADILRTEPSPEPVAQPTLAPVVEPAAEPVAEPVKPKAQPLAKVMTRRRESPAKPAPAVRVPGTPVTAPSVEAVVDPETGIWNRETVTAHLEEALARLRAGRGCVGVVRVLIDDFGRIDREHGAMAQRLALRACTRLIRDKVRSGEGIGRVGSAEFLIVTYGQDPNAATYVAERVRGAIGHTTFKLGGKPIRLTTSVGVAIAWSDQPSETLYRTAGQALHEASFAGGDQVVEWAAKRNAAAAV